jgi:TolC family type I secretion outer membrane protein
MAPVRFIVHRCALLLGAALAVSGGAWADDTFQKGADGGPVTFSHPYVGSDGGTGGMPVTARQISLGPDGKTVTLGTADRPLSLPLLLDEALRHNPSTRASWEQTRADVAGVGVARSAYYPTLTFQATGEPSHATNPDYAGGGNIDGVTYGPALQLQYLLFDFGGRAAGVEAARFQLLADNYSFNDAIQTVLLQVSTNYYTLDGDREVVESDKVSLELAQKTLESARRRFDAGLGTQTALAQARQQVATAQFNLVAAQGQVRTDEVALATSLGLPGNSTVYISPPTHLPTADELGDSVDRMIDRALRQRPDLAAKYATYRQAKAVAKQADANILPQVTVSGTAGRTWYHTTISGTPSAIPGELGGNGTYDGHFDETSALLTFSVDIFDGLNKVNKARQARRQADAAQADLANSELAAISDVVTRFVTYRSALEQYAAGEALVASSQKSYDSALISYRAGLASILDLLTAQNELASSKVTLAQARTALFSASVQLSSATGTLLPRTTATATPVAAAAQPTSVSAPPLP